MSWAATTLSTTSSIAKLEREINDLIESSGINYLKEGFNIAVASGNSDSLDVTGGMIEIIGSVATELTIKDTKSLIITFNDSADDTTFAAIYEGLVLYSKTASGDTTIAVGTELFRWVVPTNIEDYIRAVVTSDITNAGTVNVYSNAKWADKITFAKNKIRNKLEALLVDRGYKDYVDYSDDKVLIDIIANPDIFELASDLLTLHYIFRDLATGKGDEHIYYIKSQEYKADFEEEFSEVIRRINLDPDQDSTTDEYKKNWETKLIL